MNVTVRPFEAADTPAWDSFCSGSMQGTLLHSRTFLSYHGTRFQDLSLIIEHEGNWVGIFPAALQPGDASCVVSHPGSTYGGVVHQGDLRGERMLHALAAVCRYYKAQGRSRLLYKAVPIIYHRAPAQDDLYAMFRLGAKRYRCDLSSTIALEERLEPSARRRRSLKKALKSGVQIAQGEAYLPALWSVIADNLERKHGKRPVHSLAELAHLMKALPDHIQLVCAILGDTVIAGVLLFITPTSWHAQYIAANETGYQNSALDLVFEHCIAQATLQGKRWFDFGISTEADGMRLNETLHQFKSEFGAGGIVHEFFELNF